MFVLECSGTSASWMAMISASWAKSSSMWVGADLTFQVSIVVLSLVVMLGVVLSPPLLLFLLGTEFSLPLPSLSLGGAVVFLFHNWW